MPESKLAKAAATLTPDPHYRCEGADWGADVIAEIHFQDPDGAYYRPVELYHANLFEKSSDTECNGFFCTRCIEAFKLRTDHRITLQQALTEKLHTAQAASEKEIIHLLLH